MSVQPDDLFSTFIKGYAAVARADDPQTSWDAARSVDNQTPVRMEILRLLRACGAMTDDQLARVWDHSKLPVSPSGLRTRRAELVDAGLVEDTGARSTTHRGRHCIVWRAQGAPVTAQMEGR